MLLMAIICSLSWLDTIHHKILTTLAGKTWVESSDVSWAFLIYCFRTSACLQSYLHLCVELNLRVWARPNLRRFSICCAIRQLQLPKTANRSNPQALVVLPSVQVAVRRINQKRACAMRLVSNPTLRTCHRTRRQVTGLRRSLPSASPTCGYTQWRLAQQQALVDKMLSENPVYDPDTQF